MKIAVSACLLGEKVRFDGGHKHDRFVTDELFANYKYYFKVAIVQKSSIKTNKNVIEHMVDFFKKELVLGSNF